MTSVLLITEKLMMVEKHLQEMNDLADIMFAMDQNFQDRENDAKSEYQSMRDEIKNKVAYPLIWDLSNSYPITL